MSHVIQMEAARSFNVCSFLSSRCPCRLVEALDRYDDPQTDDYTDDSSVATELLGKGQKVGQVTALRQNSMADRTIQQAA